MVPIRIIVADIAPDPVASGPTIAIIAAVAAVAVFLAWRYVRNKK